MNLFVLRHGLAVERTIPGFKLDRDRPLMPKGRKKTRQMAALLRRLQVSFDLILSSPYLRARQTAEIVAEQLGLPKSLEMSSHLAPGQSMSALITELNRRRRSLDQVLLVGHEPDLSRLISVLVTGKPGLEIELKKGALCKLDIATLRLGRCATLQWLLPAKLALR